MESAVSAPLTAVRALCALGTVRAFVDVRRFGSRLLLRPLELLALGALQRLFSRRSRRRPRDPSAHILRSRGRSDARLFCSPPPRWGPVDSEPPSASGARVRARSASSSRARASVERELLSRPGRVTGEVDRYIW